MPDEDHERVVEVAGDKLPVEVDVTVKGVRIRVLVGLIHSDDSQIVRSSSSSHHEGRNCRERYPSGSPSA